VPAVTRPSAETGRSAIDPRTASGPAGPLPARRRSSSAERAAVTVVLDDRRGQSIDIFGHRNRSRLYQVFRPVSEAKTSSGWTPFVTVPHAWGPITRSRIQLAIRLMLVSLLQSRAMRVYGDWIPAACRSAIATSSPTTMSLRR
jgi:hypothetical protein